MTEAKEEATPRHFEKRIEEIVEKHQAQLDAQYQQRQALAKQNDELRKELKTEREKIEELTKALKSEQAMKEEAIS